MKLRIEPPVVNCQKNRGEQQQQRAGCEDLQVPGLSQSSYQFGESSQVLFVDHHLQAGIQIGLREIDQLQSLACDGQIGDPDVELSLVDFVDQLRDRRN